MGEKSTPAAHIDLKSSFSCIQCIVVGRKVLGSSECLGGKKCKTTKIKIGVSLDLFWLRNRIASLIHNILQIQGSICVIRE